MKIKKIINQNKDNKKKERIQNKNVKRRKNFENVKKRKNEIKK